MSATTAEATREELLAEFVGRDALHFVENAIFSVMGDEDLDVLERLDGDRFDRLVSDPRHNELFLTLWPEDEGDTSAEYNQASGEACYIAARILRAVIYHADDLRTRTQDLFELAEKARGDA